MSSTRSTPAPTAVPARRRRRVAVLTAVTLAVGGGAAFAYRSSTGTGTGAGHAVTGTATATADLTITQTAAPTDMAPGVAPDPIIGTITNNDTRSAYVTDVTVAVVVTPVGGGTCVASDYVLTGAPITVMSDIAASDTMVTAARRACRHRPSPHGLPHSWGETRERLRARCPRCRCR